MKTVKGIVVLLSAGVIVVGVGIFAVGFVSGAVKGITKGTDHTVLTRHATKTERLHSMPHVKQVKIDAYDPNSARYECEHTDNIANTRSPDSWMHSWWAANRYACKHHSYYNDTTARLIFGDGGLREDLETQAHTEKRVSLRGRARHVREGRLCAVRVRLSEGRTMKRAAIITGSVLLGLWLFLVVLDNLNGNPKADAQPARAHPRVQVRPKAPAVKWGGITKAQALRLAHRDDLIGWNRLLTPSAQFKSFADIREEQGADWMRTATYAKVLCSGRAYWKLTFKYDEPRPSYESAAQGMNVGDDSATPRSRRTSTATEPGSDSPPRTRHGSAGS